MIFFFFYEQYIITGEKAVGHYPELNHHRLIAWSANVRRICFTPQRVIIPRLCWNLSARRLILIDTDVYWSEQRASRILNHSLPLKFLGTLPAVQGIAWCLQWPEALALFRSNPVPSFRLFPKNIVNAAIFGSFFPLHSAT